MWTRSKQVEFWSPRPWRMSHLHPGRSCLKMGGRRCPRRISALRLGLGFELGFSWGGLVGVEHFERLLAGLVLGCELWFLSATDLDLSLFDVVGLGSGLGGHLGSVKCTEVMAMVAVGLVDVAVQVASWVLDGGRGCVLSLELAVGWAFLGRLDLLDLELVLLECAAE